MSTRLTVSCDSSYLTGIDNTIPIDTTLTSYQASMLLQVALLLLNRAVWQDMSNTDWDNLQAQIADTIEQIQVSP